MADFVPAQKNRKPGDGEKTDPTCSGTGRVNGHMCTICHGSGVVPDDWQKGDGPVSSDSSKAG